MSQEILLGRLPSEPFGSKAENPGQIGRYEGEVVAWWVVGFRSDDPDSISSLCAILCFLSQQIQIAILNKVRPTTRNHGPF